MRTTDRALVVGAFDPVGDAVVELMALAERPAWHRQAACRGHPQAWWFPDRSHRDDGRRARAICEGCPVREPCADHGLAREPEHGVWGGLTISDRRQIRRDRAAS